MTDEQFRQLCNTFGFAPSRALREMIDCATARDAAELRRLHAECNDLAHQLNESNERNGRIIAQRDALLEALEKMVAVYSGQVQNDGGYTVLDSVRPLITDQAALKAVEEKK